MQKVYRILLLVLLGTFALGSTAFAASEYVEPVSYTHLTLPTIA